MNNPANNSRFTPRLRFIGVMLVLLLFLLSGCSESFEENPVVQSLREGDSAVDLSRDKLDSFFDEYSVLPEEGPENVEGNVESESQEIFNNFITRVENSDVIQYQRMISYSAPPPEPDSPIDKFLQTPILHISEMGNHFVVTDINEDNRLISISDGAYFLHLTEENPLAGSAVTEENPQVTPPEEESSVSISYGEISLEESYSKNLLYKLSKDTNLTLLSVDVDDTGETTQIAFNVSEGDRVAKWYFDQHGNLFLRIFKEQEESVAIRYDFLDLEPSINEKLFTLEGAKTLPSLKSDENPDSDKTQEETEKSEKDKIEAERIEAERIEKEKTLSEVPKQEEPTTPIPENSPTMTENPPVTPMEEPIITAPPKEENKKNPSIVLDYTQPQNPPRKEIPPEPVLAKNYPKETFPLMPGFVLNSSSDTLDGLQRVITVSGGTNTTLVGASSYYDSRLSDATNYRTKEYVDNTSGYNYSVLSGTKAGWSFNVEVAESHHGGKVTVSIYLSR